MCLKPETIYRFLQCAAAHMSCTEGRSGWLTEKLKHQQGLTADFFITDSRYIHILNQNHLFSTVIQL